MLRLVEGILKRHLDDAVREYEKTVEMSIYSPWDILWNMPSFEERRALARELITAIRGIDLSTLRRIPTQEEAEKFLKTIIPEALMGYDIEYHAKALIEWLEYRPYRRW